MAKTCGYPTLSKGEKADAVKHIGTNLSHVDQFAGGPHHAIAAGIKKAAPEKHQMFVSRGTGPAKPKDGDGDKGGDAQGSKPPPGDKKKPPMPGKPTE